MGEITGSQNLLAIPTAIIGLISMVLASWLCWISNDRLKKQITLVNEGNVFPHQENGIYRRMLLLRHIKYMAGYDVLLSLWIVLNWGSIAVLQSFALQNNRVLCYMIAMLFEFSFNGTTFFYILITVTMLSIISVGFTLNCCNGWLCQQLYPKKIESMQQWSRLFRFQFGIAFAIQIICLLIPIRNYGAKVNAENDAYPDKECWVGGHYQWVPYGPMIIAFVLALLSVINVWTKRGCASDAELLRQKNERDAAAAQAAGNPDGAADIDANAEENNTGIIGKNFAMSVTLFAGAFWTSWIWVFGTRMAERTNVAGTHVDLWVLCMHHYMIALTPVFNFLVWYNYNPGGGDQLEQDVELADNQ